MSDIFISYAREDREWAARLAGALTDRGWSVWWDRNIPPGKSYDDVIRQEIEAAGCVVVLWSQAAVASHWVQDEADEGQRRGILVPALIEEVRPPLGFRRLQAAHLAEWNGDADDEEFKRLVAAIAALLPPRHAGKGAKGPTVRDKVGERRFERFSPKLVFCSASLVEKRLDSRVIELKLTLQTHTLAFKRDFSMGTVQVNGVEKARSTRNVQGPMDGCAVPSTPAASAPGRA